jgi:hypothetical protein
MSYKGQREQFPNGGDVYINIRFLNINYLFSYKMKLFVLLIALFKLTEQLTLNHLDYYVDLTVGGKTLKLKLDILKSYSIINYENLDESKINSKVFISGKKEVKDEIIIADQPVKFSYFKGDDLTLGLGLKDRYGKDKFSFVDILKNNNITSRSQFTITNNKITFDDDIIPEKVCKAMSTEDLTDAYSDGWLCDLTYILFNNGNNTISQVELDARAVFDYKTNYMKIPKSFQQFIITNYRGDVNGCTEFSDRNETIVTCLNKKAGNNLYIGLGENAFRMGDMVRSVNATHSEFNVRFMDDEKVWVLGRPFLKEYTVSFDKENKEIGLSGGDIVALQSGADNWYLSVIRKAQKYFWLIIISTVVCLLLLIIVIYFIVRAYRRSKLEEHGPLMNDSAYI